MVDTSLSSLVPKWRPAFSSHYTFFEQISSSIASWLTAMRALAVVGVNVVGSGVPLETASPWDRLMASSPPRYPSPPERFWQEGALVSSLLEFTPRFGKHNRQVAFEFDKQLPCTLPDAETVTSTPQSPPTTTTITLSKITILVPAVPTIIVTDIDGPPPCGINESRRDEMYRAVTSGQGLLWCQWSGKFSPSRCGTEVESGDEIYREDELEEGVEVRLEDQKIIPLGHKKQIEFVTLVPEEPKPVVQESRELEWWEMEEVNDETENNCDEESYSDELSDSDSDSDSDDNEDEDEDKDEDENSQFSDSEDGDDEYGDDSDDSGEDSDLFEELQDNKKILALTNSAPHFRDQLFQTSTANKCIEAFSQDIQNNGQEPQSSNGFFSASSSCLDTADSDFESYNSCTTTPSTPTTLSSPYTLPVDHIYLIKCKGRCWGADKIAEPWQLSENAWRLSHLDLELGNTKRVEWDLELGHEEIPLERALSVEGLDLAQYDCRNS